MPQIEYAVVEKINKMYAFVGHKLEAILHP